VKPCGVCHYCGDECDRDSLFCSKGCADAHEDEREDPAERRGRMAERYADDAMWGAS
jgi:hypothetical protein